MGLAPAVRVERRQTPKLQRCGGVTCPPGTCGHDDQRLSRAAGGPGPAIAPPLVREVLATPGSALHPGLRTDMERRLGHDFGGVRVHAGSRAAASADAVASLAYTVGDHIVLGRGVAAGDQGRRILAHELVHTLQQRRDPSGVGPSPVSPSDASERRRTLAGGLARTIRRGRDPAGMDPLPVSSPSDASEREAERVAQAAMRRPAATVDPGVPAGVAQVSTWSPPVVQRQPSPPAVTPPAPDTEDCEPWQTATLTAHLTAARAWVDDAYQKIAGYAYVFASPRHSAVPKSAATASVVRSALLANFHTTAPGHVLQIRDNFLELRTELNQDLTFECEDEGCESNAYVRGKFAFIRRWGDIHVCPPWFSQDYFNKVRTLIHERAHQYPGATDNAYNWEGSYATLSPDDAIDNADSYAVTARQIYHGGSHGPGT
jgi:Domain of unknown function (DUF4157)/Lysine-specific metallo-endopeptidase